MGRRLDPAVAQARLLVRRGLADLAPGDLILVATSGGPDSLALAVATSFVAPRQGLRWGAVIVDHALQERSDQIAATAAEQVAGLGADPVRVVRVRPGADAGPGPEAAARAARYDALRAAAAELEAAAVLLGHTRDDQAETVLLGLARGSGARSLAGMPPRAGLLRRPLLELTRQQTRQVCTVERLVPWVDPHNADPAFARSRVRARVLPLLEQQLGPGVAAALARTAALLRDDADLLDALAAELTEAASVDAGLRVGVLAAAPPALRRRALRGWALASGAPATDLNAGHVLAVERLVIGWHGQVGVDLPGRLTADRVGDTLRIRRGGVAR